MDRNLFDSLSFGGGGLRGCFRTGKQNYASSSPAHEAVNVWKTFLGKYFPAGKTKAQHKKAKKYVNDQELQSELTNDTVEQQLFQRVVMIICSDY